MIRKIIRITLLLLLLFPILLWIFWLFESKRIINVLIFDKTVLNTKGVEHRSFNWVLNNMKVVKPDGDLYSIENDYFGFFPAEDFQYDIKDFSNMTSQDLDSLAEVYDMTYFTDTYGIYHNEWYRKGDDKERSDIIYGGMQTNEYEFLKKMIEKKKTVITEFSLYALPTPYNLRKKTEDLLRLKWTNWVGRYFSSLDTIKNKELPKWVSRLYKNQHGGKWPFRDGGIVYVNTNDQIVILDEKRHMEFPIPIIYTPKEFQEKYELPENIIYPFWFAVTLNGGNNNVISAFSVKSNPSGDSILNYYRIPKNFVAAVEHITGDSNYYYFSADFCDNEMGMMSSKMNGIRNFRSLFYSQIELENRKRFFWEYYIPLIKNIVDDHEARMGKNTISTWGFSN
ncbi:MAG TPA: hypothetical protein VK202_02950 [Bacteroidia bacterium]|nr:hypothetical protein [Bacteroidia bacterium]